MSCPGTIILLSYLVPFIRIFYILFFYVTTSGTTESYIQTDIQVPSVPSTVPRPLTPSTRIAALNLVGDLLQKVAVSHLYL